MQIESNFSDAISWWIRGLSYLCPSSLRKAIIPTADLITIERNEQDVSCHRYIDDSDNAIESHQFNTQDDIEKARVLSWLNKHKERKSVISLVLPDAFFLKKKMSFPKATSSNLRQVLSYEMNRKTPFSPEQVYFDYLLEKNSGDDDKIHPELFLVPREKISSQLEELKSWEIDIDAIRPATQMNNADINLIPPEDLPNNNGQTDKTMMFLISAIIILLLALLYSPIITQKKELSLLETSVADGRKTAIQLQKLKQDKLLILEQSQFLENKRKNEMSSIFLLDEVTKILPDDTWLTRFVIKEGKLQLQGESSNASSLIQTLESSQYFTDVQFRSPVTQNKVSNKDKFHLSASYSQGNS